MNLDKREETTKLFDIYKGFLTQKQKQSLYLYLIEDLSISEISKIVITSRQAINDSIKKGIEKLKKVDSQMKQ